MIFSPRNSSETKKDTKEYIWKVFSKVFFLCGTAYTFENKDCRAGPVDHMEHFTQMSNMHKYASV